MMKKATSSFAALAVALSAAVSSCTQIPQEPSYLAMETNSGRVLYASNAGIPRPIGMLANIATAAVVIDWIDSRNIPLDRRIIVPASAVQWPGTNKLMLQPGDSLTIRDALHSTIMWDDSASAATLAYTCGSFLSTRDPDGAFVTQMNKLALTLGMVTTRFMGSHGNIQSNASAMEMARLSMYAIERPLFQAIGAKEEYVATVYPRAGVPRNAHIVNTNSLLGHEGVDGVRSARSKSAGYNLAVSAKRPSVKRINPKTGQNSTYAQRLLVIILGARSDEERTNMATSFLRDGWAEWEAWQQSGDYSEHSKFIQFQH